MAAGRKDRHEWKIASHNAQALRSTQFLRRDISKNGA